MRAPATGAHVGPDDRAVIAGGLGRQPRGLTGVAVRCPFGYPAVTEAGPVFEGGIPNPTLLYITCPTLAAAVSRAEASGGVRELRSSCERDPALRGLLEHITKLYRERRRGLYSECEGSSCGDRRLGAGIGGPEDAEHASCLHAYAAALLAVTHGWLVAEDPQVVAGAERAWARFLPPLGETWCTDRRCSRWSSSERRAVIDVGTISVRLLVAEVIEGSLWPIVRRAVITRLGEGLVPGGPLADEARSRTADAVCGLVSEAREQGVSNILLAGTSAAREAADGRQFLAGLAHSLDITAKVLSGAREAQLAYTGASLDVPDPVVLDIGGGSTELVVRGQSGRITSLSLPLGASRATDRWVSNDPPLAEELEAVAREAASEFARARKRFGAKEEPTSADGAGGRLVGVAGTVTTLAALSAGLERYDGRAIHLRTLSLAEVGDLLTRLSGLTNEQRAALPCVQSGRAPVIVAGTAILVAAMETLGYQELTVSERDLLDGLAIEGL